jgi:DNA-binding LytR/AlgR family response regulator
MEDGEKTMLWIAVCDDDESVLKNVEAQLNILGKELNIAFTTYFFHSAEELLMSYPQKVDLLFLDVQMPGMSGLGLAQKIRQHDSTISIVFMSNYAKYAVKGYKVQAYRYLLKPITTDIFREEIKDLILRLENSRKRTIFIATREKSYSLAPQDIMYIETLPGKHLDFHCQDRKIEVPANLRPWEEKLQNYDFYRCHNAYLVNLAYVDRVEKEQVILINGEILPVSRRKKAGLTDAFCHYLKNTL